MICLFKCPGCGEDMRFDITSQKLVCDVCNHELLPEEYDFINIKMDGGKNCEDQLNRYHCPTCGATLLLQDNQATCECSFCGTSQAIFDNAKGEYVPEKIIPFKIDKEHAYQKVINWWASHEIMAKYEPKKMKLEMRCVYVSIWMFDANVSTSMTSVVSVMEIFDKKNPKSEFEKQYINMKQWELESNSKYAVPEIQSARLSSYKSVNQCVLAEYRRIPSIASVHFSKQRFHGIEPFDYSEMEDFTPAYLSGLPAEQYYLKPEDVFVQNIIRVKDYAKEQGKLHAMAAVGGTEVTKVYDLQQQVEPREMCYALVPMWICSYQFSGIKKYIYVNGQTGKTDGEMINDGLKMRTVGMYTYYEMIILSVNLALFTMADVIFYQNGTEPSEKVVEAYVFFFAPLLMLTFMFLRWSKAIKKVNFYGKIESDKMILSKENRRKYAFVKKAIITMIGAIISTILLILLQPLKELPIVILFILAISISFIMSFFLAKKDKRDYLEREKEQEEVRYIDYLEPDSTTVIGNEIIN